MNKLLLIISLMLFVSCGSDIKVSSRGCLSKASWRTFPGDYFLYANQFEKQSFTRIKNSSDFFIEETIWTPFGFLKTTNVYLRILLRNYDISCDKVEDITVSIINRPKDVLFSLIPLLSQKTVIIAGRVNDPELKKMLKIRRRKERSNNVNVTR